MQDTSFVLAPIRDHAFFEQAVLERQVGHAFLQGAGLAAQVLHLAAGRGTGGMAISLRKYAWQFGTSDFAAAVRGVLESSVSVPTGSISVPSLFLMGEAEAPELKRQTRELAAELKQRDVDVTVREFTAADGADAHCQVNNLRLMQSVVFDWLDGVFGRGSALARLDSRLLC